jgi:RNA recognition motif-containing protein
MIVDKFKCNVILGKFPIDCNSDDIEKNFSGFGKVRKVVVEKIKGRKGCEFIISFENVEGMKKAVENGVVVLLFSSIFHMIFVL